MINKNKRERLIVHLNSHVNSVFKVLPLYEDEMEGKNVGLKTYVESLLFELYGLQNVIEVRYSHEYLSLLSTLESIKAEINNENSKKSIIKREVFKCISIIKSMIEKLEETSEEDGD